MEPQTLRALFRQARPASPAAVLLDLPGEDPVTYGDAEKRSGRLAHALRASGVGPGDRVAVQIEKSPVALLLYLACIRAGAVFVPINPSYTDDEVRYLLGDAEPSLLVCDPRRPALTSGAVLTADEAGEGTLGALAWRQPDGFDDVTADPDQLVAILYTSGTTGRPKGAMLSHRNLASNAVALHQAWGFGPDDVLLHALPLFHAHGLFVAVNCVLANGTGMIFLPRFDAGAVIGALPRCTVFMGVPTYYTRLLAETRLDRSVCRGVRLFVSGSAPLLAATHGEFRARTGHDILERYGTTETLMVTSNPLAGERRPGRVGIPLPGVEVRISEPDDGEPGRRAPIGQIEVRGPGVFAGYWRRPELNATAFTADGFFRTGDLGTVDRDGSLEIVGRAKDLVISGGLNVYPKEVEDVLDAMDGVLESAVFGVDDVDFGEAVIAVVVPAPAAAVDAAAIRSAARGRLAPFKVPKRVHVVDQLPRNAMGKVDKNALRARFATAPPPARAQAT